jgi:tetratricopeptide (TPR) repeat protein
MHDTLRKAYALHQAGHLVLAAQLYRSVLSRQQDNVQALQLLGVLYHQQGEHGQAIEQMGRAAALAPNDPVLHVNLAEAFRALGQLDRAAGCCRTALRLAPNFPEAFNNLGLALLGQNRLTEAADLFRSALKLRPEFACAVSNLGMTLRELGRHDEALTHFRRATELTPTDAAAQTNLGQMLLDRGQPEEALPYCQQAVRLQPDGAALHYNLGRAFRALDQLDPARAAFLEAIRLDANLAIAHADLGRLLNYEGRLDDALPWLKQAVELQPHKAAFWEDLAELYMERQEPAAAIPCWERVLALNPKRATAHHRLGCALQDEQQAAEAEVHVRAALELRPDLAAAHVSLAGILEEKGDLSGAESALREALKAQPAYPFAHGRLATLLRGKLPEAEFAALQERLADPQLAAGPRARLLFGLAHVLDARGDYPSAARALRGANALSLEQGRGRKPTYVPAEHERFVDGLLDAFGPDFFARTQDLGLQTRRPVFIFGLPRSGTTLIEQVLASHSRVYGAGELSLARQTFDAIPSFLGRSERPLACIPSLDASTIKRLAEQHERQLNTLAGSQPERIVDKIPDNYIHLGILATLFPRAVFIHCRRDLRDVAVSCWMTDFAAIRWANDPEHIATRFLQYRRLMEHWRKVLPVTIHEVEYEETVADLEGVARRLIAACGLDWEPGCLRFHETRRPVRTASVTQVRQPIYQTSVARWRHYEHELADLFARLSPAG